MAEIERNRTMQAAQQERCLPDICRVAADAGEQMCDFYDQRVRYAGERDQAARRDELEPKRARVNVCNEPRTPDTWTEDRLATYRSVQPEGNK